MSEFPQVQSSYVPAQTDVRFDIAPNWVIGFTVTENDKVEVWVSATPPNGLFPSGVSVREPVRVEKHVSKESVLEFQNKLREALVKNTGGLR